MFWLKRFKKVNERREEREEREEREIKVRLHTRINENKSWRSLPSHMIFRPLITHQSFECGGVAVFLLEVLLS